MAVTYFEVNWKNKLKTEIVCFLAMPCLSIKEYVRKQIMAGSHKHWKQIRN